MITGLHAIVFSPEADKVRAFFADTLGLNLVDDDSIADPAGNKLGGAGAGNDNFTGQVYTLDRAAPSVSSINRARIFCASALFPTRAYV